VNPAIVAEVAITVEVAVATAAVLPEEAAATVTTVLQTPSLQRVRIRNTPST
jgi:hypothetical protein